MIFLRKIDFLTASLRWESTVYFVMKEVFKGVLVIQCLPIFIFRLFEMMSYSPVKKIGARCVGEYRYQYYEYSETMQRYTRSFLRNYNYWFMLLLVVNNKG